MLSSLDDFILYDVLTRLIQLKIKGCEDVVMASGPALGTGLEIFW